MTQQKHAIEHAITQFSYENPTQSALHFFKVLGYEASRPTDIVFSQLLENSKDKDALANSNLLFQIGHEDIALERSNDPAKIIDSYLFVVVRLDRKDYPKSTLARYTRKINKSVSVPVFVLFVYGQDDHATLCLAIINRRTHKRDTDKDVLEKVSLIKDIDCAKPHRAHIDILFDLAFCNIQASDFVALHTKWLEKLSVSALNKHFYAKLFAWFEKIVRCTLHKDTSRTHAVAIRMITRIVFVWFLKEKKLIPTEVFDENYYKNLIKQDFHAQGNLYYKTVLQNLFFGCLNKPMNERRFRKDERRHGKNADYNINNVYRYEEYFSRPSELIDIFAKIPFLNGGLFECLDNKDKGIYEDYFTDDPPKSPVNIPDNLFFGQGGLFELLNAYKFTVDEATPIEEEVALDPELLGRVFENLLAQHNPESGENARKATGSYYTPREIVDYMCQESLLYYFLEKMKNEDKRHWILRSAQNDNALVCHSEERSEEESSNNSSNTLEHKLRTLLRYTNADPHLTEAEKDALINAINSIKILDPACGSGAFPMGMLHSLVHVLAKIDPDNIKWKQAHEDQANALLDANAREEARKGVEKAFKPQNALDYGRKLYLIEKCLYGVDIQSIAIQISKLRFFISLVIEQNIHKDEENLGILPLPNLETKFVAANTLIALKMDYSNAIFTYAMQKHIDAILKNRSSYFTANTRPKKKCIEEKEEELKEHATNDLLDRKLLDPQYTPALQKLLSWSPYDTDKTADFFDAQFMFGVEKFDVVIGNPPYVQMQNNSGALAQLYEKYNFKVFARTGDIYCLFYEKSLDLLVPHGVLCFITSSKWLRAAYGEKLRRFLSEKNPLRLLDLGAGVFENATVDINILLCENAQNTNVLCACTLTTKQESLLSLDMIQMSVSHENWIISSSPLADSLKKKIHEKGTALKNWDIQINFGIKTGYNEAFIIDCKKRAELIVADPKSAEMIKPLLRGRDIGYYSSTPSNQYLICTFPAHNISIDHYPAIKNHLLSFGKRLHQTGEKGCRKKTSNQWFETQDTIAYHNELTKPKIVWKRVGSILRFCYDQTGCAVLDSTCLATGNSLKYLLGVLNSKIGKYLLQAAPKTGTGDLLISVQALEPICIPMLTPLEQQPFIDLINKILNAKSQDPNADTTALEARIDALVYALYDLTDEEIATIELCS